MSADLDAVAGEAIALLGTGRQTQPFTSRAGGLSLDEAYEVAARVRDARTAKGERVVGRKIGFTNRTIWDEYGVHAPIWNYMFSSTVLELGEQPVSLRGLSEPRLEPEIVFRFAASPSLDMDDAELVDTLEWAAHGFEIVQSLFEDWRFQAADTVAAYGLHGMLLVGRKLPLTDAAVRQSVLDLSSAAIELRCNGERRENGVGSNVLGGGPLAAVRHLVGLLEQDPDHSPIEAGEIVTTGTLTRAVPVAAGETWSTRLSNTVLSGAAVRFS